MQGPIGQALALTCVGNAALGGRDVAGFWPDAAVFLFSKSCDFRHVDGKADALLAADPLAWFAMLRAQGCKGLRLHHAPQPRGPKQTIPVSDRMLVGFVGGGPAWLIEQVDVGRSTLWQGFDRIGYPQDPERKIWLNTYLRQAETIPQELSAASLSQISASLNPALIEIEALANNIDAGNFARCFADARAVLEGRTAAPAPDFARYAPIGDAQARLLAAIETAWVFGGMGSWNDLGAPSEYAADYDRLSEVLFYALNDAICVVANASYAA